MNSYRVREDALRESAVIADRMIRLSHRRREYSLLRYSRNTLIEFHKALKAQKSGNQEKYFEKINFSTLLSLFPLWMSPLNEIGRTLPLKEELFDLVIIDESSQCDLAAILPALQRAKKAVICGDPRQLRHLSFLSNKIQSGFADQYHLDESQRELFNYRDKSILDLALERVAGQSAVSFLNEHFRSVPSIIQFSNDRFYHGSLLVMKPDLSHTSAKSIELYQTDGTRNRSGVNAAEADALLENLSLSLNDENSLISRLNSSIGIISPFREQADYLYQKISDNLTYDQIRRHRILVGTPYHLQGEERDLICLSFALDGISHPNSFLYLNREDVFNVSITRARTLQKIFYSFDPDKLPDDSLLKHYLIHTRSSVKNPAGEIFDAPVEEVAIALKNAGYRVYQGLNIAGERLDLILEKNGRVTGIDLIGFPGISFEELPAEKYSLLSRAGIRVIPLPYSSWVFQKDRVLAELEKIISPI
jgi:superfamily I DNA and/or RNA helicase